MRVHKKFWTWLNGKKTVVACFYWSLALPIMAVMYPTGAPEQLDKAVTIVGLCLSYLGLGHKVKKHINRPLEETDEYPIDN